MQIKGPPSFSVVFCTARFCSVVLLLAPQQFIVLHDAPGMIRFFVIGLLDALIQWRSLLKKAKLNAEVYLHLSSSVLFPIYEKLEFRKGLFGRLWSFAGRLQSFAGCLWSFVVVCGRFWWFVVAAYFSNYDQISQVKQGSGLYNRK